MKTIRQLITLTALLVIPSLARDLSAAEPEATFTVKSFKVRTLTDGPRCFVDVAGKFHADEIAPTNHPSFTLTLLLLDRFQHAVKTNRAEFAFRPGRAEQTQLAYIDLTTAQFNALHTITITGVVRSDPANRGSHMNPFAH
jgi:hypothetical protein